MPHSKPLFSIALITMVLSSGCLPRDRCDIVCQNGGTCEGNHCICPDGYDGARCELDRGEQFLGNYTVAHKLGPTSPDTYTTSIERGAKSMRYVVKNMNSNFGTITADFRHDTLLINADLNYEQKVIGKGVMETQGGDSVLKMYYKVVDLSSRTLQDYGYDNADNVVSWKK